MHYDKNFTYRIKSHGPVNFKSPIFYGLLYTGQKSLSGKHSHEDPLGPSWATEIRFAQRRGYIISRAPASPGFLSTGPTNESSGAPFTHAHTHAEERTGAQK